MSLVQKTNQHSRFTHHFVAGYVEDSWYEIVFLACRIEPKLILHVQFDFSKTTAKHQG
jgi:hypothetical protein